MVTATPQAIQQTLKTISISPDSHFCTLDGYLDETSRMMAKQLNCTREEVAQILTGTLKAELQRKFEIHKKANTEFLAKQIIPILQSKFKPSQQEKSDVRDYLDARKIVLTFLKSLADNSTAAHIISHPDILDREDIQKAVEKTFDKALPIVNIPSFFSAQL